MKIKPFALESTRAYKVTLCPFFDSLQVIVKCFLPNSCLKSIPERSTQGPRTESAPRPPLFPVYHPPNH
jgi:hypothetical protein